MGADESELPTGATGIDLPGARGAQVGNHNIQYNYFDRLPSPVRLPGQRSASRSSHLEDALQDLQSSVTRSTTEQVQKLTDRGLIAVPWSRRSGETEDGEDVNHRGFVSDEDLGSLVAGGGQLVVIGGSQSGKTTLATRLVELIGAQTDKQPVLFTLSTWNPRRARLIPWMVDVLRTGYGLSGDGQVAGLKTALEDGAIIPVFDGFDEIDPGLCYSAADSIRQFVRERPAVLTGIPRGDHALALFHALPTAEVIELTPVAAGEVARYLLDSPKPERRQWQVISSRVAAQRGSAVSLALSSPLIAWLAKSVYAMRPQLGATVPREDATELLDGERFPTASAIEEHLLRGLVSAVFARRVSSPGGAVAPVNEFLPHDAERWLGFLSAHATHRIIAFWEIRYYAPLYRLALALSVIAGVGIGLAAEVPWISAGVSTLFLLAGLFFGFGFTRGYALGRSRGPDDPARVGFAKRSVNKNGDLRLHAAKLMRAAPHVLVIYAACFLTRLRVEKHPDWSLGLSPRQSLIGVVFATLGAVAAGVAGGRIAAGVLRANPSLDATTGARTADPLEVIRNDRRSGFGLFLLTCVVLVLGYLIYYLAAMPPNALGNVVAVPAAASIAAFFWNEWACYKVAHLWLMFRDALPWRFASFLWACHDGGILRKNGNHFEFRHQRLQDCLASTYTGRLADRRRVAGHGL
ncbi:hypothetical protein [Micromonospora sp. IBHARD004]|uniref:hypothetical protein n=1 Tax=Micromonospora sp. IBHARD004 TaxID=3457764 RepID=UPI004058BAD7